MKSEPQAPGAPAIILFRQVDRDDRGMGSIENTYVRIKILTEEGRKYANVEIPYRKEFEKISNLRARMVRPDGSIVAFQDEPYDQEIAKVKGLKYLAKTFTLPNVEVGSIVEYAYTRTFISWVVIDSHWILSEELFTKEAHFSLIPYERENVRWTWHMLPPGTTTPKEGSGNVVRLEVHSIPAFQIEDYMPPENEVKSRVDFIYSVEKSEDDEARYWQNVGKRWNAYLETFIDKRKAMEQVVKQIVATGDAPEVKLQKIYQRVQKIRNTSFELEKTTQEYKRDKEKSANNIEDVWKLGYGNTWEIAWLFLALSRAAGLEAHGVWASDRSNYFFESKLMDQRKLSASLVQVKVNGKNEFFDPGTPLMPYGLLPWSETGVPGLRLDKDGGGWVITTLPASSESQILRTAKLRMSEIGDLEGTLTVKFTGLEAWQRRVEQRNVDEVKRKQFLESEVKECIPAAIEVELTNKPDWASSEVPLVGEYKLKVPGWAAGAGKRYLLGLGLFSASEKHVFDHTNRVHPIYFKYPFQKLDDVTIDLSPGWSVSSLPLEQSIDKHAVSYALKASQQGSTLHWSRILNVDIMLLDQKYYTALRNFFQAVKAGDEEQAVLQPATASASK
jgi:transglutaminase-like putative cysteine protease